MAKNVPIVRHIMRPANMVSTIIPQIVSLVVMKVAQSAPTQLCVMSAILDSLLIVPPKDVCLIVAIVVTYHVLLVSSETLTLTKPVSYVRWAVSDVWMKRTAFNVLLLLLGIKT